MERGSERCSAAFAPRRRSRRRLVHLAEGRRGHAPGRLAGVDGLGVALHRDQLERVLHTNEFQSAYDIFPESAKLAFNLARCHERLGQPKKAIGFYEDYLRLNPAAPDAQDIKRLVSAMRKRAGLPPK